jgi:hypothetical protein
MATAGGWLRSVSVIDTSLPSVFVLTRRDEVITHGL